DLHEEFLSSPTERFFATLVGEERVDGHPAQVLTLGPKGRSGRDTAARPLRCRERAGRAGGERAAGGADPATR
ncbi:MAG: hypothetical protein ACR2H9_03825, partial [Longimicrobiaceae bacterium]